MNLRHSPLHDDHLALGAKLVEFGGFEMPLQYPSGTIAEHLACRRACAMFDVSHLGTVRVTGEEAFWRLQHALSNDLDKIAPGRAQYTHLLNESGGVLDDIIVWWVDKTRFDVMPNASNTKRVVAALGGEDVTSERAVVAVQGPTARATLETISAEAAEVPRFRVRPFTFEGTRCMAAGTGYTGEDGVECALPRDAAAAFWRALLAAGAAPAGLGARDTLRLEAGLPLHGHELTTDITPLEAGLDWVVGFSKPAFTGREALFELKGAGGPSRRLTGLVTEQRRPPRAGDSIVAAGEIVGTVSSGNYSPVLERGIALGFLPREVAGASGGGDGTLAIDTRGSTMHARVVTPPFHRLADRLGAPSR